MNCVYSYSSKLYVTIHHFSIHTYIIHHVHVSIIAYTTYHSLSHVLYAVCFFSLPKSSYVELLA